VKESAAKFFTSIMTQVYVVVGPGTVIAFVIRDIGDPALAGWIIQVRYSSTQI